MGETSSTDLAFETFRRTLKGYGVREALAYLVSLSDYRFIGIWRFLNGRANAAVHFDRENPMVTAATEVPDHATYCCYVRDCRGIFMTANALLDPRTEGHPAREAVPTYCGIPIMDPDGTLLGTLCHYDFVPRDPAAINLELMLRVASALAQGDFVRRTRLPISDWLDGLYPEFTVLPRLLRRLLRH